MRLDTLLERLEYKVVQGSAEPEVTTLINDSRKVENGSVFVCISGAVSDGHTGTDVSSVFWVSGREAEDCGNYRYKRKDDDHLYDQVYSGGDRT